MGATVPDQVEFHVAPAPVQLVRAFLLAIRHGVAALHDGHISREQRIADTLQHAEAALNSELHKVIKKDAAHAALLVAVFVAKVAVAPGLEARVQVCAKRRERVVAGLVEVDCVRIEAVVRRQVHTAAKPGDQRALRRLRGDHAHIHVHRRRIGVARVEHQGDAQCLKRRANQFRAVLRGRWRQLRAAHMRKTATSTLEYRPAFQNLGDAVALQFFALAFRPRVHHKGAAVFVGDGGCQSGLQPQKVSADGINKGAHSGLRQRAVELPRSLRRALRSRTAAMKSHSGANSEWRTAAWRWTKINSC